MIVFAVLALAFATNCSAGSPSGTIGPIST